MPPRGRSIGLSRNANLGYSLHNPKRSLTNSSDASKPPNDATTGKLDKDLDALPSSSGSEDELTSSQANVKEEDDDLFSEVPRKRQKITDTRMKPSPRVKKEVKDVPFDDTFGGLAMPKATAGRAKFGKKTTYANKDKVKHEEARKSKEFMKAITIPAKKTPPKPDPGAGFKAIPRVPQLNPRSEFQKAPDVPERNFGRGFREATSVTGSSKSNTRKSKRKGKDAPATTKPTPGVFQIPETGTVLKRLGIDASNADIEGQDELPDTILPAETTSRSSSPLSTVSSRQFGSDVSRSFDQLEESSQYDMNPTKTCPVCKAKVLASTLRQFKETLSKPPKGDRLATRQQVQFCRYHKKKTARAQWNARKYPEIDWEKLPHRVSLLQSDVNAIIDGSMGSPYSDKVLGAQKPAVSGRRQQLMNEFDGDMGDEYAGYYGGQGARVIGEELATLCSSSLGNNTENKAMTAAGGIGGYIQMVIVPEVASRLVAEDMQCDLARARELLIEGADLGQQLCEELDDEVHEDEEVELQEGGELADTRPNEEDYEDEHMDD